MPHTPAGDERGVHLFAVGSELLADPVDRAVDLDGDLELGEGKVEAPAPLRIEAILALERLAHLDQLRGELLFPARSAARRGLLALLQAPELLPGQAQDHQAIVNWFTGICTTGSM